MTKLIVCLTGMPGAGKSTIAEGLRQKGYDVVVLGDAVRNKAEEQNMEQSRSNLAKLALEFRKEHGPGVMAELAKSRIESSASKVVLVDGIRSNDEIEVLKKMGDVRLLAIQAPVDARFDFLQKRGRLDDPQTKEHFDEREERELRVGIGDSIRHSDHTISNTGLTKDELIGSAYEIIQSWMR